MFTSLDEVVEIERLRLPGITHIASAAAARRLFASNVRVLPRLGPVLTRLASFDFKLDQRYSTTINRPPIRALNTQNEMDQNAGDPAGFTAEMSGKGLAW